MSARSKAVVSAALLSLLLLVGSAQAQDVPEKIKTSFAPKIDGIPFPNHGDLYSPGGNCLGMSLTAIDGYLKRVAANQESAEGLPPPKITQRTERADPLMQAVVSYEQEQGGTTGFPVLIAPLTDTRKLNQTLRRMAKTGTPELFLLWMGSWGHANVIFGYEKGSLLLYDPNFPGETIRWPYDPVKGFSEHPKVDSRFSFYSTKKILKVGMVAFAAFKGFMLDRRDAALVESESRGRYPEIAITIEPPKEGELSIRGTITPQREKDGDGAPILAPKRVWLRVDGKTVAHADIGSDGTFTLALPASSVSSDSSVQVVATAEEQRFAGWTRIDPHTLLADVAASPAPLPPAAAAEPTPVPEDGMTQLLHARLGEASDALESEGR